MRSCSRCAAVGGAARCGGGSGRLTCRVEPVVSGVRQPPSSRPSAMAPAPRAGRNFDVCLRVVCTVVFSSVLLIRSAPDDWPQFADHCEPRSSHAREDADSRAPWAQPRAREDALLTFRYSDRKRLRPSTAKIHIYGAAALADRQHFAFDDREATPTGHQTRQIPSVHYAILRVAPQAQLCDSGYTLV